MVFWILSSPVLALLYTIKDIGIASIDLQINRILLIIMIYYLAKIKYLEKSIGKTGRFAVLPLIHTSSRELWQIYMVK